MWRDMVAAMHPAAALFPPTDLDTIRAAEATLGQPLPEDLIAFLLECDGVEGSFGTGVVWPVERIAQDNRRMRHSTEHAQRFMPLDPLLFFADDGARQHYGVVREPLRDDVFVWDRADDSRRWFARNLEEYLRRALRA